MPDMFVNRLAFSTLIAVLAWSQAASARADECRLCTTATGGTAAAQPLQVDIINGLTFSRAAHTGSGKGRISVAADGASNIGGGLIALGGYAVAGSAVIHGEPGRYIRIDLPARVEMTSSTGGKVEIANLRTSLGLHPQLDASGQLTFSFGGDLNVDSDLSGKFRGRIPITAEYE